MDWPEFCELPNETVLPPALDRLRENGEVKSGDLVLMVGFGAGLVHAAQVALVP